MILTSTLLSSPDLMVRAKMYDIWTAFILAIDAEISHTDRLGEYGFLVASMKYVDSVHYLVPDWGFPLHIDVTIEKRDLRGVMSEIAVGAWIHRLRDADFLMASLWQGPTIFTGTTEEVVPALAKACVDQLRAWTERKRAAA